MTHFICIGNCKAVSGAGGLCQDENCENHGKDLHQCDCEGADHLPAEGEGAGADAVELPR